MSETSETSDSMLAGKWKFTDLTIDGSKVPDKDLVNAGVYIEGATFTLYTPPNGRRAVSKMSVGEASGRQKTISLTVTEGELEGKTFSGIYKFEGETLVLCQADIRSTVPPTSFESKAGTYHVLMRLNRESK